MNDIRSYFKEMKDAGFYIADEAPRLVTPHAKEWFEAFMKCAIERTGNAYQPQPEYNEIIDWLSDNKGKGLLMYGNCGRGKTQIARNVIIPIYLKVHRRVVNFYNATDLKDLSNIIDKKFICLDDIGTETSVNSYGNKFDPVSEILDKAEKESKLLILTSNLTGEELKTRYGDRIFDRIISTTKRVIFNGKSLRQ